MKLTKQRQQEYLRRFYKNLESGKTDLHHYYKNPSVEKKRAYQKIATACRIMEYKHSIITANTFVFTIGYVKDNNLIVITPHNQYIIKIDI